ncbi:MAG: NAD-dependent epimerase/dehydratase family protein [Spirochaetes bacterium]|nr:NAD-dependent epimerase/dehydratase family protein [Spirochaetota bacterium]
MVAVTGASGHIGANLVRKLIEEGRAVRAVIKNDDRALLGLAAETVRADVLDPKSLCDAFRGVRVVYHLAAKITLRRADGFHAMKINLEGTRNVIQACMECNTERLVYFGSIHALDPFPKEGTVDESRGLIGETKDRSVPVIRPVARPDARGRYRCRYGPYEQSKAAAENEVRKACVSGLDAVVVSPTAVVGPYDFKPSQFGRTLLEILQRGHRILLKGGFDWVDVRDVAAGAVCAERLGKKGERYILSGGWKSVGEVVRIADGIVGRTVKRVELPMWAARACLPFSRFILKRSPMEALFTKDSLFVLRHYRHVSARKAEEELGFRPRPFTRTLEDTIEWFFNNGYLQREA